jgi:hypothetical protein
MALLAIFFEADIRGHFLCGGEICFLMRYLRKYVPIKALMRGQHILENLVNKNIIINNKDILNKANKFYKTNAFQLSPSFKEQLDKLGIYKENLCQFKCYQKKIGLDNTGFDLKALYKKIDEALKSLLICDETLAPDAEPDIDFILSANHDPLPDHTKEYFLKLAEENTNDSSTDSAMLTPINTPPGCDIITEEQLLETINHENYANLLTKFSAIFETPEPIQPETQTQISTTAINPSPSKKSRNS